MALAPEPELPEEETGCLVQRKMAKGLKVGKQAAMR